MQFDRPKRQRFAIGVWRRQFRPFLFAMAAMLALVVDCPARSDDCDNATTTVEIEDCYRERTEHYQQEVDALEVTISAKMTAAQKKPFKRSNDAWDAFREANCRSAASVYEGGTMQPVAAGGCKMSMTRQRASDLRSLYKNLLEEDEP
jgi:uncharacterized protein YecT (DUF1311 family)